MPVQVDGSIHAILDDQRLVQFDIAVQVVVIGQVFTALVRVSQQDTGGAVHMLRLIKRHRRGEGCRRQQGYGHDTSERPC